jgi:hypothetical protein
MVIEDPRISKLFNYLSNISKKAYQNEFLLANPVLAKMPASGDMVEIYFSGRNAKKSSFKLIAKRIFLFYARSLIWFFFHIVKKLIFMLAGKKYPLEKLTRDPIFIDTYFLMDRIVKEDSYKDPYFPGLTGVLDKLGIPYVYAPKIFGSSSLIEFVKMLQVLKKEKVPVLMEYQLLGVKGYLRVLYFMICYPFYVIRLIFSLGNTLEDRVAKFALWDTLSQYGCIFYFRNLFGESLSYLPVSKIKCISWYENQSLDKCFYKGLRKTPDKSFIYGAQFFVWSPTHLNIYTDEQEIEQGVVPDKVLVNGTYFLRESEKVDFQVGPAMRYEKIFRTKTNPSKMKNLLVLLSYWDYEISSVLQLLNETPLEVPIKIRFHPTTPIGKFKSQINGNLEVVEGDIYKQFEMARMVIGASTGSLVEAVGLGIPVISVLNKTKYSTNYLPGFGKGILWDFATTGAEVIELVEKFNFALANERDEINKIAKKTREMYFCEPTERKIIKAFDLA